MAFWTWEAKTRRYRLTSAGASALGRRAGTFVGQKKLIELRDLFGQERKVAGRAIAKRLTAGDITIQQWTLEMRTAVKQTHLAEYMLGRGGLGSMTQADYGRVGATLRKQYGFMNNFSNDIASGKLSAGQIEARSDLYFESASQSFERGRVHAHAMPELPQYPGDGATICRANCRCFWNIKEFDNRWECTWKLTPAEHCEDCLRNSKEFAPLVFQKGL